MKTNTIIALAAGAAILACIKKRKSTSGVGSVRNIRVSSKMLNEAKRLFDVYDRTVEIEREHDAKCNAIFDQLDADGIDWMNTAEGERIVKERLFRAGLTDENGMTDVSVNRYNARKKLFDFVNANIVPLFPIPASDRNLLRDTLNITFQNRLLDITREFVNKTLEHNRRIREILNE